MLELLPSLKSIGLELTPACVKGAEVIEKQGKSVLVDLFNLPNESLLNVKRLYTNHPILTTGLDGMQVLLRPLSLPLTKEKDIDAALAFQAEPLLPYPVDQALLARQTIKKESDETQLLLLATRQDCLQTHIDQWSLFGIEPEKISCTQAALCQFGKTYIAGDQTYLILHLEELVATSLLMNETQMVASFAQKEGLQGLQASEIMTGESILSSSQPASVREAIDRLKKLTARMAYAMSKESNRALAGLIITGAIAKWPELTKTIAHHLQLPLLTLGKQEDTFSEQDKLIYALPIGLAMCGLPRAAPSIDFRQDTMAYSHPWRRLKVPMALYFLLMTILSFVFYFFSQSYLNYRENELKQEYVNTLAGMNKSYEQFETAFLTKTPSAHAKFQGEVVEVVDLNSEDLMERLAFIQKDLKATPDSFPLFANIPRVSDVLAWLSVHPTVSYVDDKGERQTRLQIENFSYVILKRPMQGKKQDKYQVKVELEFSSPTPKWAREFHDALIAPNDWVDSKGEVKWSSNRGRYKTSFYLKDKTSYPSQ